LTFTVATAVALPSPFVATSVYVVVADGLTTRVPLAATAAPFSVTLVADDVVQASVELPNLFTSTGVAVKELMPGGEEPMPTVADASAPPSCVTAT